MKKTICLMLAFVLVIALSIAGTVAYLQDEDTVTNTFTVGNVDIELDEAEVDLKGEYTEDHSNRTTSNDYHLLPGCTYYKDPTVTVKAGSSECYVRMLVTVNYSSQLDAIFAPALDLTQIFGGYDPANWKLYAVTKDEAANTRTYEFRYVGTAFKGSKDGTVQETTEDIVLDDLFESLTIPGEITKEQLATLVTRNEKGEIIDLFTISVVAHAIQAEGFGSASEAFAKYVAPTPAP